MPNNLNDDIQRNVGFKHAQGVVNSDVDKSTAEETIFTTGYITVDEVLTSDIAYNDPEASISSGVVSSGILEMQLDQTVGGAYRAYKTIDYPVMHPKKHGNNYAPIFYHSSGTVIPTGDLFAFSTFYYDKGLLVIQRNKITDQWKEPILIDGFFYTGKFGLETKLISGEITRLESLHDVSVSGSYTFDILVNSGDVWSNQNFRELPTNSINITRNYFEEITRDVNNKIIEINYYTDSFKTEIIKKEIYNRRVADSKVISAITISYISGLPFEEFSEFYDRDVNGRIVNVSGSV